MSDQEILNPTPAEDGTSEVQEPKPRASRGRRRTTPESQDGTAMADEGQTATAVIDAPDLTDTSAERTEPREREFSRRNRNGGRNDRDRDRSGRRDRHDRGDRPERGNRADRGERSDYGPREIRSHEMEPQEFPSNGTNPDVPHFTVTELDQMEPEALIELARTFEIQGFSRMKRTDLISRLLQSRTEMEGNIFGDGVLEIVDEGYGFLRGSAPAAGTRRHLRLAVADPPLRPAHRRPRLRPGPSAEGQREVLQPAARRGRQRRRSGSRPPPPEFRHADADLPARADQSRDDSRTSSRPGCSTSSRRSARASVV